MSRKLARCADVASDNRQDHASGTLMTLPSASWATISSSVTRTSRIRGSPVNSTAVLMPCLQYCGAEGRNDSPNHGQLARAEAVAAGKSDRFEPELARRVLSLDVHMCWFVAVEAREEESVRPRNPLDSWH